jgi:hypothetical protein
MFTKGINRRLPQASTPVGTKKQGIPSGGIGGGTVNKIFKRLVHPIPIRVQAIWVPNGASTPGCAITKVIIGGKKGGDRGQKESGGN